MPENIPQKILAELISAHTGCSANDLSFLQVPTGKFNTTYFVEGAGRPMVLRIAPPDDAGFIFYESENDGSGARNSQNNKGKNKRSGCRNSGV